MTDDIHPGFESMISYQAHLVGYDVCGFSAEYERLKDAIGPRAGEIISARLIEGDQVFSRTLNEHGFGFAETTGDGALYVRRETDPSADATQVRSGLAQASAKFFERSGLCIRTAMARGTVNELTLPFKCSESATFRYGPTLWELYDHLSRSVRPLPKHLPATSVVGAEQIRDPFSVTQEQYCICVKLLDASQYASIDPHIISSVCLSCYRWITSLGGCFERVSCDEKGLLIRVSCGRYVSTPETLRQSLAQLRKSISASGFKPEISLSYGLTYRGTSPDGRMFVHGKAINAGTKALSGTGRSIKLVGDFPGDLEVPETSFSSGPRLIGRARESSEISDILRKEGFQVCGVFGERGIGKTALLKDVVDQQVQAFDSIARVKCSPTSPLQTLGTIREVINGAITRYVEKEGIPETEKLIHSQMDLDKLDTGYLALFRDMLPKGLFAKVPEKVVERAEKLPLLTSFATTMMRLLCRYGNLLLVIDECHLMDSETEQLLCVLARANIPLKLLIAAREQSQCGLVNRAELASLKKTLELGPLAPADLAEISASLGMLVDVDIDLLRRVSGGNPFYAIQFVLGQQEGLSSADQPLDEIVKVRLGLLALPQLLVLRLISFFDRPVTLDYLEVCAARLGLREPVSNYIDALERLNFARRSDSGKDTVDVTHGLVSQSLLDLSPDGARTSIYEALARGASDADPAAREIADQPQLLAVLWEKSQSPGRAAILYGRAASLAAEKGFYRSAAEYYDKAIGQTGSRSTDTARESLWKVEKAECLWAIGDVSRADSSVKSYWQNHRREASSDLSRDLAARASVVEAEASHFTGNLIDLLRAQWRLSKYQLSRGPNELARVRGYASIAYVAAVLRFNALAHYLTDKAVEIGREAGNGRYVAHGLTAKGLLFTLFGEWEKGETTFGEALSCLSSAADERALYEVTHTLWGLGAHQQGKFSQARYHFHRLQDSALRRGHKLHEGWVEYSLASICLSQGNPEEAFDHIKLAEPLIEGKGDIQSVHICAGLRARIELELERFDEAIHWAEIAGKLSHDIPPRNFSSLEAYAAEPLVYGCCRRLDKIGPVSMRQKLRPLANFAMVFPTARPRYHLIKALAHKPSRRSSVRKHLARSRKLAARFNVGSDEILRSKVESMLGVSI